MGLSVIVLVVVVTALVFDFTNGFHDTANAMATSIATGALAPRAAVTISAVLNLVGAFVSTEVATTVSGGLVREGAGGVRITPELIFAGLVGAVLWNLVTWLAGLPSSSSHALFGGLVGAAVVGAGFGAVDFGVLLSRIVLPALASPLVAGLAALAAAALAARVLRHAQSPLTSFGFRRGQIVSSSLLSLAHGTNDAQKTMGVITLALISQHLLPVGSRPPVWVVLLCGSAIATGTYVGGWRIIRTMGRGMADIAPLQGFVSEVSSAVTILASSHVGFALSTTQVCSGSILGAGLSRRGRSVRWGTVGRIFGGWVLTLPAAAVMGGLAALVVRLGDPGVVAVALATATAAWYIHRRSRRHPVTRENVNAASGNAAAPAAAAAAPVNPAAPAPEAPVGAVPVAGDEAPAAAGDGEGRGDGEEHGSDDRTAVA